MQIPQVGQWNVQAVGTAGGNCSGVEPDPGMPIPKPDPGMAVGLVLQGLLKGKCTCCHEPMGGQEELWGDLHLHFTL